MRPGTKGNKTEEFGLRELISFTLKALPSLVLFVAAAGLVTNWRYSANPSYTAEGMLQVESSRSNRMQAVTEKLTNGGRSASLLSESDQLIDNYFLIFSSRDFNAKVVERLQAANLFNEVAAAYSSPLHEVRTPQELADRILETVVVQKTTPETFKMILSLSSPIKTVRALNLMMDFFRAEVIDRETRDLEETKAFLANQIKEIEQRLAHIDEQIAQIKEQKRTQKTKLGSDSAGDAQTEQKLEQAAFAIRQQLNEVRDLAEVAQGQAEQAKEDNLAPLDKYGAISSLENLRRRERVLELKYRSTQNLLELVRKTPDTSFRDEHAIEDLYKRKELEYQLFTDLKKEMMSIDIQQISLKNKLHVLDRPSINLVKTGETLKPLLIKRCLFAAIIAIMFTFFRELYNPLVRGRKELAELGLVYMGSVPDLTRRRLTALGKLRQLFTLRKPASVREENLYFDMIFRNICARILNYRPGNRPSPKVIAIMSAEAKEGKSTISENLARAFARSGKRTLLVDCDLRRRTLSQRLANSGSVGISDYLEDTSKKFDPPIVKLIERNLEFLPGGLSKADPMQLISNAHFRDFVEAMKHYYEVILIDTPPTIPCSEDISIANASDLLVISVMMGLTKQSHIDEMIEKLQFSLSSPLCFVLNKHDEAPAYAYYDDYSKATLRREQAS